MMPRKRHPLSLLMAAGLILIVAGVVAPNGYVAALGVGLLAGMSIWIVKQTSPASPGLNEQEREPLCPTPRG